MSEPRGLRLNNPLNIERVPGQTWIGQAAFQGDPIFVTYLTPEYGYRAAARLLMHKFSRGQTSVLLIVGGKPAEHGPPIGGWAPAADHNNVEQYVDAVSKRLGVEPDAPLDLPNRLPELMHAMTVQEQGSCPFEDSVIVAGIELDGEYKMPTQDKPLPDLKPPPTPVANAVAGAALSKTVWVSVLVAILANIAPEVPAICALAHLDPQTVQIIGSVLAIVIAALRTVTTQSLSAKGANFLLSKER